MSAYRNIGHAIGWLFALPIIAFYLLVLLPFLYLRDLVRDDKSQNREEWRITRFFGLLGLTLDLMVLAAYAAGLS